MPDTRRYPGPEWPTLALIAFCYAAWAALTVYAAALGPWLAVPALAVTLALHSSLSHEVVHGHPLPSRRLSEALVSLPLGLVMPYRRFRDLHLAHHGDPNLTDPYDDPESFYLDPQVWSWLPRPLKALLRANNTLLGRMVIGPTIALSVFYARELRLMARGDRAVLGAWGTHALGLLPVLLWLGWAGTVSAPGYLLAAYGGYSILMIRTYLEHQAHERAVGRTVIIEDRGPLAFLFLNNNLHAVHHAYPGVAWYDLPGMYRARREEFLRRNLGYAYSSYSEIFGRYLVRPKEPVEHPLRKDA